MSNYQEWKKKAIDEKAVRDKAQRTRYNLLNAEKIHIGVKIYNDKTKLQRKEYYRDKTRKRQVVKLLSMHESMLLSIDNMREQFNNFILMEQPDPDNQSFN